MVRITLPNRLKSYTGTGGTNSANHSRSSSPSPGMKKSSASSAAGATSGAGGTSPEGHGNHNGLMLKVVVLKVCCSKPRRVCGGGQLMERWC